jgi:hypothetical protein
MNGYFKFATCSCACKVNLAAINRDGEEDKYAFFKSKLELDIEEAKRQGFTIE